MQITVKGKNVEVTDALRSYAEQKVGKMARYSDSIISADITFSTERSWHIVEMTLHANGMLHRGEERTGDMYASIDSVVSKMEKQIKKQKEKLIRKPRVPAAGGDFEILKGAYEGAAKGEKGSEVEKFTEDELAEEIQTVRRFSPKPMNVKEAIMEMESVGNSFFVFVNSENSRVNVVYKRPKGYGLIDPVIE
jgi:putative sigma-54 modulation protein